MPIVLHKNILQDTAFCVLKNTESEEELLKQLVLSENDRQQWAILSLPKRRLERLACRKALSILLNNNHLDIYYTSSGKPFIANIFLSFSHCRNYAAAAVSNNHPIGIDIEKISEKFQKIASRYISDKEFNMNDLSSNEALCQIWCVKEAVYKMLDRNSIDFKQDIVVNISIRSVTVENYNYIYQFYIIERKNEKYGVAVSYQPQ
jgi:phosphopantetheinyl transferase